MSSVRAPHTVGCERAPLREVQNERSGLQQTPSSIKVCEVHTDQKENLSQSSFITESDPNLCSRDANMTFKSFTCAGGEVEISEQSDLSDRSVVLTHVSPDVSPLNNTTVTHEDTEGRHEDHPYCRYTSRTEEDHTYSDHQSLSPTHSLITFTSFTCPGGEVEITGDEPVVAEVPELQNLVQSFGDESSKEHTELPSRHFDHLYCNTLTSETMEGEKEEGKGDDDDDDDDDGGESVSSSSISKNITDIIFKSFTCPGGEVEIVEESLVKNESLLKNESLVKNESEVQNPKIETCEEHTELPSRHFDHLYCNIQTSELRSEEKEEEDCDEGAVILPSISKNSTDITFKSFTCPGEVKSSEESLVQNESPVMNQSLVTKDSEVQTLQSDSCGDQDRLPSSQFDPPYCNDGPEGSPVQIDSSIPCSNTLDANHLEEVVAKSDSYSALIGSSAVERRDDLTFCFSGAEVEIENTYRTSDMSMLMKGLKIYEQAEFSPNSELSVHCPGSVLVGDKDDHVYCPVVRNDPEVTGSESDTQPNLPISTSGVVERVVKNKGSENAESDAMIPESSFDSTEVQAVGSVQQQDLDQTSAKPEENVLKNENPGFRCDDQEVVSGENSKFPHSHPGVDGISKHVGTSETQIVQNIISRNANNAKVSTQDDPEILRSESVEMEAQLKMWSHIILSEPSTPKHSAVGHLWLPESPIPPPQLHSTVLTAPLTPKPASTPELQKEKVMKDLSAVGQGPLQDQLRKMGELLIAASGKFSAPVAVTSVQQHSACVGTTPMPQQERSTNTSAVMEDRKEIDVSDACTSTDSLLWSVSRSNLECLSRPELEQKLISTLIMVEILSQQLTSAQDQNLKGRTEPSPSSLRDRLVQTERTELSQTGPYRELYVSALERIQTLELDQETFNKLHQAMQLMNETMMSIKSETEEALSSMKELEGIVTDDQKIHSQQLGQMKALFARCMDMLRKMEQKNKVCVKDRDDMRKQMEEALEKESTVLRVLEQLRVHHSTLVSDLQSNLGSHEELTDALTHTYPQLVELNRMHMDSVTEANTLLRETMEEHTRLSAELHTAQQLLQRTYPLLHKLQHRASAALEQSQKHQEERDQAVEDREQMVQQLYNTHSSLQEAHQQIADLNTQMTIMSSEMTVLREQLTEVEDERSQLQRKVTELSATVSTSLASYTFLEQTLSSETSKLQHSLHDTQEATERANSLQAALCVCEKRVEELEETVVQRETLISELSSEIENQRLQLRRLTQVQSELSSAKEMSEFLQAENELTREQLSESEGLLRSHLQGLRERNLECEDLRVELQQLRVEKECVEQELVSTRDKARLLLLDQGEQLAQATLDTSLLLQRVCALINNTHTTDHHKSSDGPVQTDPSPLPQPCSSFLNSVINALTEDQPGVTVAAISSVSCVEEEDLTDTMGSRSSAFTRILPADLQNTNDNDHRTTLLELLSSLSESVSKLHSAIEQLKQHKDSEMDTLQKSMRDLQGEMEEQKNRHMAEEAELKQHVARLKCQVEKDAQVLQQKTQDEKALRKLCSELEEKLEAAQKHRSENSELRREGADLRCSLMQSQVEVQALRAELKSTSQSASGMKELEDRLRLLREVEKLKANLMEVEESRSKLLERAKRHQMVHSMNQSKLERELHLLDDMIETVRKALSSVPDVVNSCPELQKLLEYLG